MLPAVCSHEIIPSTMISALREHCDTIRHVTKREISDKRGELFKIINDDAFFPLIVGRRRLGWHSVYGTSVVEYALLSLVEEAHDCA